MSEPVDRLPTPEEERALASFAARVRGAAGLPDLSDISALSEWSAAREQALVRRILTATTREDLSVVGDARLCVGFFRARLRESLVLRVLAASLLLHLIALPVLAWIALRDDEPRGPRIFFAPPEVPRFGDEEAEPAPVAESDSGSLETEGRAGLAQDVLENVMRRDRYLLTARRAPLAPAGTLRPGDLEMALLAARSTWLSGRQWDARFDSVDDVQAAGPVIQALWCELLLDRFLLAEADSLGLAPRLQVLVHLREGGGLGAAEPSWSWRES